MYRLVCNKITLISRKLFKLIYVISAEFEHNGVVIETGELSSYFLKHCQNQAILAGLVEVLGFGSDSLELIPTLNSPHGLDLTALSALRAATVELGLNEPKVVSEKIPGKPFHRVSVSIDITNRFGDWNELATLLPKKFTAEINKIVTIENGRIVTSFFTARNARVAEELAAKAMLFAFIWFFDPLDIRNKGLPEALQQ